MKANRKPADETPITFGGLVRTALQEHDGDEEQTIEYLIGKLMHEEKLLHELLSTMVAEAVAFRVRSATGANRATIVHNADRDYKNVMALANFVQTSLLDFPLAGGLKLRHAKRDDLTANADRYGLLSKDTAHKQRFLKALAGKTKPSKSVGECLSDEQVTKIWKETSNA